MKHDSAHFSRRRPRSLFPERGVNTWPCGDMNSYITLERMWNILAAAGHIPCEISELDRAEAPQR